MDEEYIMCQTDFFVENDHSEIGQCVSLVYMDRLPNLPERQKYITNFESQGLKVVDYEVKFRPIRVPVEIDHTDFTKH
ncbi:MAG: hypothetical protein VW810_00430 [Pelagibacteraceae bacterium]